MKKKTTWRNLTNNLERSIKVSPLSGGKDEYYFCYGETNPAC